MSSTTDDVVVRLRLADVQRFIREVRSGRLSIDELERRIARTGQTGRRESGNYGGLGLWGATVGRLKYAIAGLTLALGSGATAMAMWGIKAVARLEQVKVGFKTLLGSQAAADKMVSNLQEFAKTTPFQLTDLEKYTTALLGFGMQADAVIPSLTAMGNAISAMGGTGADLESVIIAMGQISTKGRLLSDEILQLQERHINPYPWLAKGMGVSNSELRVMIEKGKVGSAVALPLILKGMQSQYGGAMQAQSHTLAGTWSNIIDAATKEVTDRLEPFKPMMQTWLTSLLNHVGDIAGTISAILGKAWSLGSKAVDIGKYLGSKAVGIDKYLVGKVQSGDGKSLGLDVQGLVTNAMSQFGGWMRGVDWLKWGKEAGAQTLPFLIGFLAGLFDIGALYNAFMNNKFDFVMGLLSAAAVGKIVGPVAKLLSKIPILKIFAPLLEKFGKFAGPAADILWKPARAIATRLAKAFGRAFEKEFPEAAVRIWYFFARLGQFFRESLPRWIRSLPGKLGNGVSWLFERIFGFGMGLARRVIDGPLGRAIGELKAGIVEMFTDIWRAVWEPFSRMGQAAFKAVFNAIAKSWNSTIGRIPGLGNYQIPPMLAAGGTAVGAGSAIVGERGPELVNLPRGASVIPLPRVPDLSEIGSRPIQVQVMLDRRVLATALAHGTDDLAARR